MSDIKQYCTIRVKAKEILADVDVDEIERIKRRYFGLNGAGKGKFTTMKNAYNKIRENRADIEDLKL